jgi:hypothetical protein
MKYTVKHAFADRQPGDVFEAGTLSEVDVAYLLQTGAIEADESAEPTPKRARKVRSESEE